MNQGGWSGVPSNANWPHVARCPSAWPSVQLPRRFSVLARFGGGEALDVGPQLVERREAQHPAAAHTSGIHGRGARLNGLLHAGHFNRTR